MCPHVTPDLDAGVIWVRSCTSLAFESTRLMTRVLTGSRAAEETYCGRPLPCRPHFWSYTEPFYAIDERFERADGPIMPEGRGSVDKLALHHYVLKCAACNPTPQTCSHPHCTPSCSRHRATQHYAMQVCALLVRRLANGAHYIGDLTVPDSPMQLSHVRHCWSGRFVEDYKAKEKRGAYDGNRKTVHAARHDCSHLWHVINA